MISENSKIIFDGTIQAASVRNFKNDNGLVTLMEYAEAKTIDAICNDSTKVDSKRVELEFISTKSIDAIISILSMTKIMMLKKEKERRLEYDNNT